MVEKLSLSLARKLLELRNGTVIPSSKISGSQITRLHEENALHKIPHGRTKFSYYVSDKSYFDLIISRIYEIDNLGEYIGALECEEKSREVLVSATRDSKIARVRSFKGFLVNCYEPVDAMLNGESYTVSPAEGTFVFIYDFESFTIPEDVVIIGVENPENFSMIRSQLHLFSDIKTLFLSRYPQSQHSDVRAWLMSDRKSVV